MKKLPLLITLASALTCSSLLAEEAKLVQVTAAGGIPEGTDFSVKPMGYQFGIKLTFFVEGQNIIEVDKDSLKAEGWKFGNFPRVSKDGSQASFSITKKGNFVNKVDSVKVSGTVQVKTGSAPTTKTLTLKSGQELPAGNLKVKLKTDGKSWSQGLVVSGNHAAIKEMKVMQGGKEIRRGGWSGSGNSRTYFFKGIKTGAKLALTYYTKTGVKTISFSK